MTPPPSLYMGRPPSAYISDARFVRAAQGDPPSNYISAARPPPAGRPPLAAARPLKTQSPAPPEDGNIPNLRGVIGAHSSCYLPAHNKNRNPYQNQNGKNPKPKTDTLGAKDQRLRLRLTPLAKRLSQRPLRKARRLPALNLRPRRRRRRPTRLPAKLLPELRQLLGL